MGCFVRQSTLGVVDNLVLSLGMDSGRGRLCVLPLDTKDVESHGEHTFHRLCW